MTLNYFETFAQAHLKQNHSLPSRQEKLFIKQVLL